MTKGNWAVRTGLAASAALAPLIGGCDKSDDAPNQPAGAVTIVDSKNKTVPIKDADPKEIQAFLIRTLADVKRIMDKEKTIDWSNEEGGSLTDSFKDYVIDALEKVKLRTNRADLDDVKEDIDNALRQMREGKVYSLDEIDAGVTIPSDEEKEGVRNEIINKLEKAHAVLGALPPATGRSETTVSR